LLRDFIIFAIQGTHIGYTSGGFQSNLQAPGSLARAVTVDNESTTKPARCIPSTLPPMQKDTSSLKEKNIWK